MFSISDKENVNLLGTTTLSIAIVVIHFMNVHGPITVTYVESVLRWSYGWITPE